MFICGGAFDGLEKIVHKGADSKPIGFNADIKGVPARDTLDLSGVQQKDLVKYGLMPELIGRLPVICTLNPLSIEDMVRILTEPKNAIVKQYQELFAMDGVSLEVTEEALDKIASKADERKIGARGLRSIIENFMKDIMFKVPDMPDVKKVVITPGVVDGIEEAVVYGSKNKKIA